MKKESNLHGMNLHGLLVNGGIHHESKICQFVVQVIRVIGSIIDDIASDKTSGENYLQRRELFVLGITPQIKRWRNNCFHEVVILEVENSVKTCGTSFLNNRVLPPQSNQIDLIVLR